MSPSREPSELDCLRIENLALKRDLARQAFQSADGSLNAELDRVFTAAELSKADWMIDTNGRRFVKKVP